MLSSAMVKVSFADGIFVDTPVDNTDTLRNNNCCRYTPGNSHFLPSQIMTYFCSGSVSPLRFLALHLLILVRYIHTFFFP